MQLFYRHFGTGRPLVILHGLFGLSDNWVTFGRQMADRYSVYIPDLRNHGQSPHSNVFDFPALENDLGEFIEEHELQDICLLGHSLGGKVSMFFALHHPEIVKKLVVVDISLRRTISNQQHLLLLKAMSDVDFSSVRSRSDVERQLARVVESPKLRQFLLKSVYWRTREKLDWRLNLKAISENLLSIFESVAVAGSFTNPALFVRGGLSDYVRDTDIPDLKAKFPGATVETIVNASHWVHADDPGEFYTLVSRFLDQDQ